MADIQSNNLPDISTIEAANTFIMDSPTLTGKVTAQELLDWIEENGDFLSSVGISDVTGLQAALDSKADSSHTHPISQVVGLENELDSKYDATSAGILGNTVIIGSGNLNVGQLIDDRIENITGVSPTDARIPSTTAIGDYPRFSGTDGTMESRTSTQVKQDLELNNVNNTADIDKPISSSVQVVLNTKVDNEQVLTNVPEGAVFTDTLADLTATGTPTTQTISAGTGSDAVLGSATESTAGLLTASDKTKLNGIEARADVTDTANTWSSLGISNTGRTGYVLSERGVFVQLGTGSGGDVDQLITGISVTPTSVPFGGGQISVTVTGVPATVANLSFSNVSPAGWIDFTSDGITDPTEITLDSLGTATTTIAVPQNDFSYTRALQIGVTAVGNGQETVLSEVVTQFTNSQTITSVTLEQVDFTNEGDVETIIVTGVVGTDYNLEIVQSTPVGWITSGAFSGVSGSIPADGTDESHTITIPTHPDDSVSRSFRIRARDANNNAVFADSVLISQVHAQSTAAGNLVAEAGGILAIPNIDFSVTVSAGDPPFTAVLNQSAEDATVDPIQTLTFSDLNTPQSFTTLASTDYPNQLNSFYIHISDNDGDMVVEMEQVDLSNTAPTGSIDMNTTSTLLATYLDAEGDDLTYQWQRQDLGLVDTSQAVTAATGSVDSSAFGSFVGSKAYYFGDDIIWAGTAQEATTHLGIWFDSDNVGVTNPDILLEGWIGLDPIESSSPGSSLFDNDYRTTASSGSANNVSLTDAQVAALEAVFGGNNPVGTVKVIPTDNIAIWESTDVPRLADASLVFADIPGETQASIQLRTAGLSVADAVDKSTIGRINHSIFPNLSAANAGAIFGSNAQWGLPSGTIGTSVFGVWNDNENHATTLPFLYVIGSVQTANADVWTTGTTVGAGVTYSTPITDSTFDGVTFGASDFSSFVMIDIEQIPDANFEIWTGIVNIPGNYRVIVSDGQETVTSNEITI